VTKEYIIYCDESVDEGTYYSNFYGGVLIRSDDIDFVRDEISRKKRALNLNKEVKWQKVTENYLEKYIALMDLFFDLVAMDKIKVRIMFTQNINVPVNLTAEQEEDEFFILYYMFLKHAFGLPESNGDGTPKSIRLLLDQLPNNKEKAAKFKGYLCGLSKSPEFRRARITISPENIVDVRSHDHDILQCLDVVLGAMQFRLNDKHKEKPEGKRVRGRRTRAKEALYKHINKRIRQIYPRFNIGTSTGGPPEARWQHPYRHWCFTPRERQVDLSRSKRRNGKK